MKKLFGVLIVFGILGMVLKGLPEAKPVQQEIAGKGDEPKSRPADSLKAGNDCQLNGGGFPVLLSVSEEVDDRLTKLSNAKDEVGIKKMVLSGLAFVVPSGTKARIISKGFMTSEVRIMEGERFGKSGFLPSEYLAVYEKREEPERKQPVEQEKGKKGQLDKLEDKVKTLLGDKDKDAERAADLLKTAKRWIAADDKELAQRSLDELLKRFPDSAVADEAKKLKADLVKRK